MLFFSNTEHADMDYNLQPPLKTEDTISPQELTWAEPLV